MELSNIRGRAVLIVIVTGLLVYAFFHSGIRLGQDLKGGTTLRFTLDIEGAKKAGLISESQTDSQVVDTTLEIIDKRINATGLEETNLTQYGTNKFEISLPADSANKADSIINIVSQLGELKFRIEVHPDEWYLSARRDDDKEPPKRLGVWPKRDRESFEDFMEKEIEVWRKARARGEKYEPSDKKFRLVKAARTDGSIRTHFHLVEEVNLPPGVEFDGGMLEDPVVSVDQMNEPVVVFGVENKYQNKFGEWTGANIGLPMAIILNEQWHSAPVIQDQLTRSVQISLGRQRPRSEREEEAKELATVLQTGALKVRPELEARTVMGATLAGESRDRGIMAVVVAFLIVLVLMLVYYRGSGAVANVALLLNLVMLVGFLAFFQAVLTLPGIAGIVLTVGMAVDANILINERIREERRGGRTLRRAVSEGYDRALSAIIDANVTSIITAIFLYNFGSGPVRGFAVTLAIGLMVSMFTAIFVTRTITEWLMRKGVVKEVSALGSGEPTRVRWLSLSRYFAPISVIGVVAGLITFAVTDRYTLYDVDFTGGYKMTADFHSTTTPDKVKERLATTTHDIEVEAKSLDAREKKGTLTTLSVGPYDTAQVLAAGEEGKSVEIKVQRLFTDQAYSEETQADAFRLYVRKLLGDLLLPDWRVEGPVEYAHTPPAGSEGAEPDPLEEVDGGMRMVIAFRDPERVLEAGTLEKALREDLPFWVNEDDQDVPYKPADKNLDRKVVVKAYDKFPAEINAEINAFEVWMKAVTQGGGSDGVQVERDPEVLGRRVGEYLGGKAFLALVKDDAAEALRMSVAPSQPTAEQVADAVAKVDALALSKPFPSEDQVGSSVAERLKDDAMLALFLSLVGIIVYIAVRFHSRSMGFAAVLCLFHDVAITLGLVALANTLGIVDAKINLAMVAAFLTLVGYSVNDTVVVFDRIRENKGKRPTLTRDLINLSINQTLARTIRTSVTFLVVCLVLFAFNYGQRNVLEGFAFLLILGSFIGTYSTLAISTPLLLYLPWLWERAERYAPKSELVMGCLTNPLLLLFTPVAAVLWLAWAVLFAVGLFVAGLLVFVPWALTTNKEGRSEPYARRAVGV